MLKHLILIADIGAISFCHYESPQYNSGYSEVISIEVLSDIVDYAKSNNLKLNVLLGHKLLPKEHLGILNKIDNIKFVPLQLLSEYPDAIPVINWAENYDFSIFKKRRIDNIVLRIGIIHIAELTKMIRVFMKNVQRINLILSNIEEFSDETLIRYEIQLRKLKDIIAEFYLDGNALELSCLSDRLLLYKMKNCDAGIRHITVGTNGKFYICPGFFHSDSEKVMGSIKTGMNISFDKQLILDSSPICSNCDAFHCRRCVYLNKVITRELNIPSRQQCIISHLERNASRQLLNRLKPALRNYSELPEIPEIDYLDPLEMIKNQIPNHQIEIGQICKGNT